MLFNSAEFALFLPLVIAAYFLFPARLRWILLLFASYYFYACWRVEYLTLIIGSTFVDYWVGLRMGACATRRERRPYLVLSLLVNLGLLGVFKYADFFGQSVQAVFDRVNIFYDVPVFDLLLPVGISFYTFQTLSYSIDVYRGERGAEKHLGIFALYVAFFPQLVAGPIERSTQLLPQLRKHHVFDHDRFTSGLMQMLWGFFKKIVIADRASAIVQIVYGSPAEYSGAAVLVATYLFAIQIFCDFSGYSDIAIGSARIFGIDLMENFRSPYFSKSISEFWRRWHISLSTWFRDYLYIPLGGSRRSHAMTIRNVLIVFTVSGLWHGANWTFVVWGALHGIYMAAGNLTKSARDMLWGRFAGPIFGKSSEKVRKFIAWLVTLHLVMVGWVFFRADNISDAISLLASLNHGWQLSSALSLEQPFTLLVLGFAIMAMELVHLTERRKPMVEYLRTQPRVVRWGYVYALILAIIVFGNFSSEQFIYFQF